MKSRRQMKILSIIKEKEITTQGDLVEALRLEGMETTQATVSRDIKELGLIKAPTDSGDYRYTDPSSVHQSEISEQLLMNLRNSVVNLVASENILVIHTLPATAQTVAEAIDALNWPEILGTLGGERTVFAVVASRDETKHVQQRLHRLCKRGDKNQNEDSEQ